MQFIVKYSAEVTIKSKPVRTRICQRLVRNLRVLLKPLDPDCVVKAAWEKLHISINPAEEDIDHCLEIISCCPGIANFLEVQESPLKDFDDVYARVAEVYLPLIAGRSFAVRCRRVGVHDFSSVDVERYVGGELAKNANNASVKLKKPDITVGLEIRGEQLYVTKQRVEGAGGFPTGSLDPVMALMSGGFDSTVASYLAMRRGLEVHFLLFRLGGREHELAVQQVALYLWLKFASAQKLNFITVPFEPVVDEIQRRVESGYTGVVMKRLMLQAGEQLSRKLRIKAMLTGEAVAQVSSQTLSNLAVIDSATNMLVFRPLSFMDKGAIIDVARSIGTEPFSRHVPEYCGAISRRPRTKTRESEAISEEARMNPEVLQQAIDAASIRTMDELLESDHGLGGSGHGTTRPPLHELAELPAGSVVVDIRHPDEQAARPLQLSANPVRCVPFFELNSHFPSLRTDQHYYLYCDQGMMSRLHASYLTEAGHKNVGVYRPGAS